MYTNRRAILFLVANGRITSAEAERLIAACACDREAWWLLAGCALCAGMVQLQPHAFSGAMHLFRSMIDGSIPALHHALMQAATYLGVSL
ncbi:MAG TPA: hypothetical protein VL986_10015 [Terracidiphilus sp.]|nr:hypothetical protein [Terracidiphilus sp.]